MKKLALSKDDILLGLEINCRYAQTCYEITLSLISLQPTIQKI